MADPLRPIQRPDGSRVRYAIRDPITASSLEREIQWLHLACRVATAEHDADGIHDTPKIPRALIDLTTRAGILYDVSERSYHAGKTGEDVATVTRLSVGRLRIQLTDPLPSTDVGIEDASGDHPDGLHVRTVLAAVIDEKTIEVRRYEGDLDASELADGPCSFAIFA